MLCSFHVQAEKAHLEFIFIYLFIVQFDPEAIARHGMLDYDIEQCISF